MAELLALLTIYYKCTALAEAGLLTQTERFACNHTYQEAKRHFLDEDLNGAPLTAAQNVQAYRRFKDWEVENAELVRELRGY